MNYQNYQKTHN